MTLVVMDRKWEINTKEDYDKAMEVLDGNEFCANMSDDFYRYNIEMAEIRLQRYSVQRQAIEKGIV